MKILFAAHQFLPDHCAGTEVITLGLARALNVRGHETAVFAAKRSAPSSELMPGEVEDYAVEGVPVRRIGRPRESLLRSYRLNYDNLMMAEGLGDYLQEFRPDVVHFMHLQGLSAAAIPIVRKLGIPTLYTATDFWTICPVVDLRRHDGSVCTGPDLAHCPRCLASRQPDSRIGALMQRTPGSLLRAAGAIAGLPLPAKPLPLRRIGEISERPAYLREQVNSLDRIVAPTRLTRDLLISNGVIPELVGVSRYGVNTSNITRVPRRKNTTSGVRFGFIGTLGPHKGCDLLIRAFKRLPPATESTLSIYGGGEAFSTFQKELKRLAQWDERITFAGSFPPPRVGEVLAALDVLVVPSRWYENTPMVIYEAFAAGVPVVATNLGGMSEVVEHEKNGLLFPLDDVDEFARTLRRLTDEPHLIERLRSGIEPVKTVEESAVEMEGLYGALIKQKAESPKASVDPGLR
jgi:glycosyltransferase involved in cell wall biosynthesis